MSLSPDIVRDAVRRFERESDRYRKLVRIVEAECWRLVKAHHIPATVQSRVKDERSLERKLDGYISSGNATKLSAMPDVDAVFTTVGDLAGVRVATYVEADRERVVHLVQDAFQGVVTQAHAKSSGYRATHCQVALPPPLCQGEARNLGGVTCEIQVCSMLAHVWNEIEHDMRYKLNFVNDTDSYETSRLQALLELTKSGDKMIEEMLSERALRIATELEGSVAARFPASPDFGVNGKYVIREAVRLGCHTEAEIAAAFLGDSYESIGSEEIGRVNALLEVAGEATKQLNPMTADLLFALVLKKRARELRGLHFEDLCSSAPTRYGFLARFYVEQVVEAP